MAPRITAGRVLAMACALSHCFSGQAPARFLLCSRGIVIAVLCHLLPDFNEVPPEFPATLMGAVTGRRC